MRPDEVVVVLLPLPGSADGELLNPDERRRAASLRRGRAEFVGVRSALRRVLGAALDLPPRAVLLHAPPGQKPRLVSGQGADVRFSVSHADGLGAVALSVGREVGVDVERVTPRAAGTAARALRLTPRDDVEAVGAWCAAEAVAKASLRGLPAVLRDGSGPGWTTTALGVPPGWAGAVAARGAGWSVVAGEIPS